MPRNAKNRCVKTRVSSVELVLGDDIQMNEVVATTSLTLVSRFFECKMGKKMGGMYWLHTVIFSIS